ncbi:MAG: YbbR-like domain-containing protein [Kiritimatiellia bacterium]
MKILRKTREFLATRNGTRLVAAAVAVVVWYAVRAATSNSTLVTDIPLAIQPPPDWSVVDVSAKTIDVAFLGTRDDLRYLNRELIKASIDARDHTDASPRVVVLGAANVNAPGSARIDFIRPAAVTVRLDREIAKQVPVKLETQNLLPDGYEIEKVVVTPAAVELSGPALRLADVESVRTFPIDLDGRIRSINKRRLSLVLGDHMGEVLANPTNVTVDIAIVERSVSSLFPDLPIHPMLPTGRKVRVEIEPETATLTVKGRPELMKDLAAEDVRLFVDAADIENDEPAKRPLRAVLPNGVVLVRAEPAHATVRLKE